MTVQLPIGISDFAKLRECGAYYIDKTQFIVDLLATPTEAVLLPRPRRFGKTLNLSALRYFLEKGAADRSALFEGLAVWRSEAARRHFARYPVVSLTFKDVKMASWADAYPAIRRVIAGALGEHDYLLADGALRPHEARAFQAALDGTAGREVYATALGDLTRMLARYHGERAVVLIDEYDIPIHSGFTGGYLDEVTEFFRNFLSGGLKDNPHLYKGVLTGVLRVAKENIFSGLNNVRVHGVLGPDHASAFGFTEDDVAALVGALGRPELMADLRQWYDGYRFGEVTIYNPWSVLNFALHPEQGFRPYWVFTSSDDVLRGLVLERGYPITKEVATLLGGGTLEVEVEEHVALREVATNPAAIWGLLLHAGYLTARSQRLEEGRLYAGLALPNAELRYVWEKSVRVWVDAAFGKSGRVQALWAAMLAGEEEAFGQLLEELVMGTLSPHHTGGAMPERVYQGFILGMLVDLSDRYTVRSEVEAGLGRCDVAVTPRRAGLPGAVLELKRLRERAGETVEHALAAALGQLAERRYAEPVRAAGATAVREWAVVFDGKRVWVRRAGG
jgi:hypothetical protein